MYLKEAVTTPVSVRGTFRSMINDLLGFCERVSRHFAPKMKINHTPRYDGIVVSIDVLVSLWCRFM